VSTVLPLDGAAQRQVNAARCLGALRDQGRPLTISQLAALVGLSRPTVEAVLSGLDAPAPIADDGRAGAIGAGRPARRFSFRADAGCVAGVDVGPHLVRVLVSDLAGRLVRVDERETDPSLDGAGRIAAVEQAVREATAGAGTLRAVGLALPGILDRERKLTQSLAIPAWVGEPVGDQLSAALLSPVVVENDTKLAALAEQRLRAVSPSQVDAVRDLLFVHLGHRVALAVMINGEVLQGSHGIAGELGTMRGMRWTTNSDRGQLWWRSARTAEAVFAAAARGEDSARREIVEFCGELAPTLATILLTVDPSLVVIGGGLSRAGSQLLDPLTASVHQQLTVARARPVLEASFLVDDGPARGALGLAFERLSAAIVGVAGVQPPWSQWLPVDTDFSAETQPPQERR